MQDFSLNERPKKQENCEMSVSGVFQTNGKQKAYVNFARGNCKAEGLIPDCIISKNDGFSSEEIGQLEYYMKMNLTELKKMASKINVFDAFMGKKK